MDKQQAVHEHSPEWCAIPPGLAFCKICREPLLLDDAGFRPLTGLEFEELPNQAIQKFMQLQMEAQSSSACDHVPAYPRVMLELKQASDRWIRERPPGSYRLLRFLLPPEHIYIAAFLGDVVERAANGCPHTKEFLEYIDAATQGQATLTQLRMLVEEFGVKVDPESEEGQDGSSNKPTTRN